MSLPIPPAQAPVYYLSVSYEGGFGPRSIDHGHHWSLTPLLRRKPFMLSPPFT